VLFTSSRQVISEMSLSRQLIAQVLKTNTALDKHLTRHNLTFNIFNKHTRQKITCCTTSCLLRIMKSLIEELSWDYMGLFGMVRLIFFCAVRTVLFKTVLHIFL